MVPRPRSRNSSMPWRQHNYLFLVLLSFHLELDISEHFDIFIIFIQEYRFGRQRCSDDGRVCCGLWEKSNIDGISWHLLISSFIIIYWYQLSIGINYLLISIISWYKLSIDINYLLISIIIVYWYWLSINKSSIDSKYLLKLIIHWYSSIDF